jgi:glycosyltransferase involved in cell wall biosynthesis
VSNSPDPRVSSVGIFQNRIGLDGRSRQLGYFLRVLNDAGHVPLLLHHDLGDRRLLGGRDYIPVRIPRVLPVHRHVADQIGSMASLRRSGLSFDRLLVNDGHVGGRYPADRTLNFICAPLSTSLRTEVKFGSPGRFLEPVAHRVLTLADRRLGPENLYAANSAYSRDQLQDVVGVARPIPVLYPPVELVTEAEPDQSARRGVVLLGRVERAKVPIGLVASLSKAGVEVTLVGRVADGPLASDLRHLPRVAVVEEATDDARRRILRRSALLLHAKRHEHFGLAPIEAVAEGCLPVVHDSGGCRETVPLPELRFQSDREAVSIVMELLADPGKREARVARLRSHITERFAWESVRGAYEKVVQTWLHA